MPADTSAQAEPQPWTDRTFFAGLIKMVDETPTSAQNKEENKTMLRRAERMLLAGDNSRESSIKSRKFWYM
jgi:predicted ATPase